MQLDTVLHALKTWFFDHGWHILVIMAVASLLRRFGLLFVNRIINHSIESSDRFENKRDRKLRVNTLLGLIDSVLKITSYVIIGLLILSELNILKLVAPLLAGAGVLSLLLGFGIQAFVKDFISGIFIVAENQYRVGDVVSVTAAVGGNVEGTVIRITLRTTVLRDKEGAIHFIPNGNITRAANQTLDYARVNIELAVPLTTDLDSLEKAVGKMGIDMKHEGAWHQSLLQAPYYHGVKSFDTENITVEVRARTTPTEQWKASSEIQKRLAKIVSQSLAKSAKATKKK
mgnify:FL=1